MKKFLIVVLIALMLVSAVFAGDFKLYLSELDQHPEILAGFLPTLLGMGVRYEGLHFMEGNTTQLQASVGGGYIQRQIFRDPMYGQQLSSCTDYFDVMQIHFAAKLSQGFGDSWVPGKDLVTAYVGYDGTYEKYYDSLMLKDGGGGLPKKTDYKVWTGGTKKTTLNSSHKLNNFLNSYGASRSTQTIYPELQGSDNLTNVLFAGATLNYMDDRMVTNEGLLVDFKFQYAPKFINKRVDYYTLQLNAVGGTTLYELQKPNGLNMFSIVLLDRANVSWIDGKAVPVLASNPFSLGRKVRGFDKNSFATNFAVVNNFDIRFASPEPLWDGIFVRLNLFFDIGCYSGRYVNTGVNGVKAVKDSGWLASAGAQLELCIMDMIDLGVQYSHLIHGNSIKNPDTKNVITATFFLDF